jgi:hypothetical protein
MLKQKCNKTQASFTFKLADVEHEEDDDDNDGIFLEEGRVIEKKIQQREQRGKIKKKEETFMRFFSHLHCMYVYMTVEWMYSNRIILCSAFSATLYPVSAFSLISQ